MADFYGLGIAPNMLETFDKLNFKIPIPIQVKSIRRALEGKDIIGVAQTGTGKTLTFGVPMIAENGQALTWYTNSVYMLICF